MNFIKTKNYGFTLIELILVIAITTITSILVVPQFGNSLDRVNEEIAVNKIMDDIRYAQNYAMTNHCNTWFSVDLGNNAYSYGYYETTPNSDPQLLIDPATNQSSSIMLSSFTNVEITGTNIESGIDFDWFGESSSSGVITINNNLNINIAEETGYVYQN